MKKKSGNDLELIDLAKAARLRSHSPYSKVKVGAAVRTRSGQIFGGCNVENSSFGATVCAERVAIQSAVVEGCPDIVEIAVVTDASPPWPPCGMCRQVMAEFSGPNLRIVTANLKGQTRSFRLSDLMPQAFTPSHLKK